jgi:hypothetical protein
MPRFDYRNTSVYLVFSLFSMFLPTPAQAAGSVALQNNTTLPLCVYVGNNVLTCHFAPNAKIKLMIPTKVIYNGQSASVNSVTVTNASSFSTNTDGSKTQNNITLCQTQSFSAVSSASQWPISAGNTPNCSVQPVYPMDRPNRSTQ